MKPGYKQTEVGVIPVDWEVKAVSELGTVITGPFGTLLKADEYLGTDGVPLISVGEVGDGAFRVTPHTPKVPAQVVRRLPQFVLREGDIVFGRKGAVDRSALVSSAERGWFLGSDGISVRPSADCYPPYLAKQFQAHFVKSWLLQQAIGTTMASLNQKTLRRAKIAYAPLPEQRAIAKALSDVDGLLGGLDRLIAKKRDLKQAAIQQLFTAQTRLPGFHGEWTKTTVGTLGTFLKGAGVKKDEATSGDLPCVRYGEIYTHHHDIVRVFNSHISPSVAAQAMRLRKGDVLFAGSGETKSEIGKAVAFLHDSEAYAGGDIVILRPTATDSAFLGYYLNSTPVQKQKAGRGQGDAVVHISASSLSDIEVRIPSEHAEQTAIAAVLSKMDAELEVLGRRREKTRDLKQAMMQQLLTGQIRLV